MFDKVEARFAFRCVLVGLATFVSALQASAFGSGVSGGEVLNAVLAGALGGFGYAGIGAASPAVEPNIGRKRRERAPRRAARTA